MTEPYQDDDTESVIFEPDETWANPLSNDEADAEILFDDGAEMIFKKRAYVVRGQYGRDFRLMETHRITIDTGAGPNPDTYRSSPKELSGLNRTEKESESNRSVREEADVPWCRAVVCTHRELEGSSTFWHGR